MRSSSVPDGAVARQQESQSGLFPLTASRGMTDKEILTLAARHNIVDKLVVCPRAEEILAFARDLAGAVMAELGAANVPPGVDWRAAPRVLP